VCMCGCVHVCWCVEDMKQQCNSGQLCYSVLVQNDVTIVVE